MLFLYIITLFFMVSQLTVILHSFRIFLNRTNRDKKFIKILGTLALISILQYTSIFYRLLSVLHPKDPRGLVHWIGPYAFTFLVNQSLTSHSFVHSFVKSLTRLHILLHS